tara:strand:- start:1409 stop:1591 length:183 start_codon:yes stop_codon:yes gene_type:complete
VKRVRQLSQEIQASDDVQDAMEKYATAMELLQQCATVIEEAKGQLEVLKTAPLLDATDPC